MDTYPVYYPVPVTTYVQTVPAVQEIYVQESTIVPGPYVTAQQPTYSSPVVVYPPGTAVEDQSYGAVYDEPAVETYDPSYEEAPVEQGVDADGVDRRYIQEDAWDENVASELGSTPPAPIPNSGTPQNTAPAVTPAPPAAPTVGQEVLPEENSAAPAEGEAASSTGKMDMKQVGELMMEGTQFFTQGRYDEAARNFLKVMMAHENNVDSILAYAVARFATGDYNASSLAVQRGILLYPDVVNSSFDIRDRYGKMEDFDEHYDRLVTFVLDEPTNVDGWVVLGFVQHFTGLYERAAEAWQTVRKQNDKLSELVEIFLNADPPEREELPAEENAPAPMAPTTQPSGTNDAAPEGSSDAGTIIIRRHGPSEEGTAVSDETPQSSVVEFEPVE